jgi:hypothetical protein
MERTEVYKAIDSERDYQDQMTANPDRPDMIEDFHVGDGLTAIKYNLDKAVDAWYVGAVPHQDTMKYLRKIAGIITKLGEVHGLPPR